MDGLVLDRAVASVFRLADPPAWRHWRERKLASRAADAGALVVEVRDPRALTPAERAALLERCARANIAIYASGRAADDPDIATRFAAQLGLRSADAIDGEWAGRARIPWHTEGYGEPRPVRSMVLHCAQAPAAGGELALMDPELAWLLLRDMGACFVDALMQPDAMTLAASGRRLPAFAVEPATGELHVRFTERRDDVAWKCDAAVSEAAARLRRLLDRDTSCVLRTRLEPGMGLVANNVLYMRAAAPEGAGLVRGARFRERLSG
ncbi:MAG TPA: TauD/TfdA family dioxygenase [Usitatibacter sp.]|nr:TauD/TfdA family dioxygenase [Usitatibacter sp.]